MATLKIDHRLIARIRTNLPSARVRADLKPITERVINPVLSGAITVPADVKTEIESLQAQLLQIVPTLPKGAPIAPIDIDALVTPVPAPLPQPLPQPLPAPLPVPVPALAPAVSPAQSTDPNAGRMSVFTQQAAMQAIQGAAAAAAANPAPAPVPAPNPARQLGAAQAEVERLSNQLVRLEQESADIIQAKQNELVKEQEHAHRLETSLGGARDKAREMEAERDKAKARVTALEKELVALRTSQQAVSDINDQL
ncbi:MAG: hypothetical protein KKD13_01320, partial [Candidatus Margulisbacteria bacterium]|nr:hypothetical protein [Candidatus Margulisiibacteriota bacterium]